MDMHLVAAAAAELIETPTLSLRPAAENSRPVLEAGLMVTYCRSFSGPPKEGRRPQHVVDALAPESPLHAMMWEARNKVHAHTDEDYAGRREALDVSYNHTYEATYPPHFDSDHLTSIRTLAFGLAETFKEAREARESSLRDAGVSADPP